MTVAMPQTFADAFRIRHSARAKRLRLVVKPGLVELVAPLAANERQAQDFLARHRSWAEKKLHEMAAHQTGAAHISLSAATSLPWRGKEIPLTILDEPRRNARVELSDEACVIRLPATTLGAAREQLLDRALMTAAQKRLGVRIDYWIQRHAARYGLYPRATRIKRMKSRWGSCGPRNDLNINLLLAFVPDGVLEYVVVHELCHIRERNHGPAFWQLVALHLPEYMQQRRWLKTHGSALLQRFC
ncbi:M48 family metallopeptidase [Candidatus Methylospira mobilis]|uniref:M48 family metallopeptidase n=2 Tax=Candidatus Methylospira mobilis TaxID=1808979 RepID=A0A5Q0BPH5_9GAMM|nr:SprT family zinc-dependent metalloprotease [Candidatus Methylospira mobilis]QFY43988.1 M48 family metallopeptidase [Candidatus Methylospira mobilis]WNV04989.1 SprT family zinc-dependent metalloprotease [Candidatus Methylospira mobilis]